MKIKSLFILKGSTRKKVIEFMEKKGFYVVLLGCLLIIGATALYVTTTNVSSSKNNLDTDFVDIPEKETKTIIESPKYKEPVADSINTEQIKNTNGSDQGTDKKIALNDKSLNNQKAIAKATTEKEKVSVEESKNSVQDFTMPVFGKVTFGYSTDKLVYSKTLSEWRTHNGVDISSDRGTSVKAVADGVVSEIKTDPGFGIMITINHQNGLSTVYANLAGEDMVSTNLKVKQGDVIGAVGNTASFEAIEPPHLHFEVLKNNEPVDPSKYLSLKD